MPVDDAQNSGFELFKAFGTTLTLEPCLQLVLVC